MKKIAILILSILIAGLFVACNQDITVDAQTYANMEVGTFVLNGQNYATLQAAVDAIGSKAAGANVIYLTRHASGPGAKIANKEVTIDFQGYTYSFTNVNGLQGQDVAGKDFGLSITSGSDVVLKGMEKIDLNDKSTTNLTMVYVEGKETKLAIESAPKMVVEPDQYVFWAADGASLTIGGKDATESATVTGKVAATGTEESKPTITVQGNTELAGGVEATSANVKVTDTASITGSLEAAQTTTVVVESSAKIEASVKATETSEVVISSTEKSTITNLDKESTATVTVAGGEVQVDEIAVGSDPEINTAGDATISGDASGAVEKTVDASEAIIEGTLYTYFCKESDQEHSAYHNAKSGDTIKLLKNCSLETLITIPPGVECAFDFNGCILTYTNNWLLKNYGVLTVNDSKGNGGIDCGKGAFDNLGSGILTINGCRITASAWSGSTVRNGNDGNSAVLVINGSVIETNNNYAVCNCGKGSCTINGAILTSHSTSQTDGSNYGYCVSNYSGSPSLVINGDTVINAVHGAIGVSTGSAVINSVDASTKAGDSHSYYAIYVAGEHGVASAEINGGVFTGGYREAAHIGNTNRNGDGGEGHQAYVNINGGKFIGYGTNKALNVDFIESEDNFGNGNAFIYGGEFSKNPDPQNKGYVAPGLIAVEDGDLWKIVPVFASGAGTEEDPFIIENAEQFGMFRDSVNRGSTYEAKFIQLNSDITLSGAWTPIGNGARATTGSGDTQKDSYTGNAFKGTFDGNGKTIKNLSNDGYTPDYKKGNEYTYGLFGVVQDATINNLTLSDVGINAPKETSVEGDSVGAVVGYSIGSLELTKCTVSGSVTAYASVGGIAGRVYGLPDAVITISECTNNATVTGSEHVAGVVGWLDGSPRYGSGSSTITVEKCVNNGDVTDNGFKTGVAGVFCFGQETRAWSLIATGNANHGTLTQTTGGEFGYVATCDSGHDYYRITYLTYTFAENTNDGTIITSATRDKFIISAMGFDNDGYWTYTGENYTEYNGTSHTPNTSF